jgi:RNA polymerase sigma-70 factor (ECF subfamily)
VAAEPKLQGRMEAETLAVPWENADETQRLKRYYAAYAQPLIGYLTARLYPLTQDAEEIALDTLVEGARRLPRALDRKGEMAWLFGIARKKMASFFRCRKREMEVLQAVAESSQVAAGDAVEFGPVYAAIRRLPDAEAEAVSLKYAAGYSTSEIAAALNRTPKAVESLLRRARARLSAWREQEGW